MQPSSEQISGNLSEKPVFSSLLKITSKLSLFVSDILIYNYHCREDVLTSLELLRIISTASGNRIEKSNIKFNLFGESNPISISDFIITPNLGLMLRFNSERGFFYSSPNHEPSDTSELIFSAEDDRQVQPYFYVKYSKMENQE